MPVAWAAFVMLYAVMYYDGAETMYRICYYAPAAFVLGSLAMDRWRARRYRKVAIILDALVLSLCIVRPLYGWPAVSGHAVLFVYALMSGGSRMTIVSAALLGVITLYAKLILWGGDTTLWPGLIIGFLAGCWHRAQKRD